MLRVRTRGATRLSWSTMKVRKLELTGIRTSSNSSWRAPTGSRLSCGRPARRRKGVGRRPCPIRGTTLGFPQKRDRKSTRLNSSHGYISYAVFCLKKKKTIRETDEMQQLQQTALQTKILALNYL